MTYYFFEYMSILSGNNQVDLRTVLAKFYDLKAVPADLFCLLKENANDQDSSRLYTIRREGVMYKFT